MKKLYATNLLSISHIIMWVAIHDHCTLAERDYCNWGGGHMPLIPPPILYTMHSQLHLTYQGRGTSLEYPEIKSCDIHYVIKAVSIPCTCSYQHTSKVSFRNTSKTGRLELGACTSTRRASNSFPTYTTRWRTHYTLRILCVYVIHICSEHPTKSFEIHQEYFMCGVE